MAAAQRLLSKNRVKGHSNSREGRGDDSTPGSRYSNVGKWECQVTDVNYPTVARNPLPCTEYTGWTIVYARADTYCITYYVASTLN